MKNIIDRLTEARMEVTRIYANLPQDIQVDLCLKADSVLQEEIGKLKFAKCVKGETHG